MRRMKKIVLLTARCTRKRNASVRIGCSNPPKPHFGLVVVIRVVMSGITNSAYPFSSRGIRTENITRSFVQKTRTLKSTFATK